MYNIWHKKIIYIECNIKRIWLNKHENIIQIANSNFIRKVIVEKYLYVILQIKLYRAPINILKIIYSNVKKSSRPEFHSFVVFFFNIVTSRTSATSKHLSFFKKIIRPDKKKMECGEKNVPIFVYRKKTVHRNKNDFSNIYLYII